MRLPEICAQLHVLAADLNAAGVREKASTLRTLAVETRRSRPVRKARPKAAMTDQTRDCIRDIARACGVNKGV